MLNVAQWLILCGVNAIDVLGVLIMIKVGMICADLYYERKQER